MGLEIAGLELDIPCRVYVMLVLTGLGCGRVTELLISLLHFVDVLDPEDK